MNYKYDIYNDVIGEEYLRFCDEWFDLVIKKSKLVIITTGWKYKKYWYSKNPLSEMVWFDSMKQSGGNVSYMRKTEPIFIWGKLKEKYKWDIFEVNSERGDGVRIEHTCPKPILLWKKLIIPQIDNNSIVFDPFMGSGTTGVACEQLEIKWFGCEISPNYCKNGQERVDREKSQLKLL